MRDEPPSRMRLSSHWHRDEVAVGAGYSLVLKICGASISTSESPATQCWT